MKTQNVLSALVVTTILATALPSRAQVTQIIDASGDGQGATLSGGEGIAVDADGNVYVAGGVSENVFKIAASGAVTLLADIPGTTLLALGVDGAGNVFVQDFDDLVYKITPAGSVTPVLTAVGDGVHPYEGGEALTVGANGTAYAAGAGCANPAPGPCPEADLFANVFRISPTALPQRVLDRTGNGLLPNPDFFGYEALAVDSAGNLYAALNVSSAVFKVTPSNAVSIVIDPTLAPGFASPTALATDAAGNVFVACEAGRLFRVSSGGEITQILSLFESLAPFAHGIAAGPNGAVYLAGISTDNVVQVLQDGTQTVILDASGDGVHPFAVPGGVAVAADGTVYVSGSATDNAFKIIPPGPFELSSAEQRCVNALNKGLRKVSKTQAKEFLSCIADHAKGTLGAMTIEQCAAADRKSKLAKATSKVSDSDARDCATVSPPFGATGGDVVSTAAVNVVTGLSGDLFGADLDAAVLANLSPTQAASKCQQAVAKSLARCEDAHLNEFVKCKKEGLKSGSILVPAGITACVGDDPRGRIAKSCDATGGKVRASLDASCDGVDLASAFPGRCALADSAAVAQCLHEAALCRACRGANSADALEADCDPVDDGLENGSCVPICGDGFVEGADECDDGNTISEDGCSADCKIEVCGDGTVQPALGEQCDDGNTADLDGCDANCIDEFCGDGIANDLPNEQCDGSDDALCPGSCQSDCSCSVPILVGSHQCRPAAESLQSYYDSPTASSIDGAILAGRLDVDCGQLDELTGRATCSCDLVEPIEAFGGGLLTLCLLPTGQACATGEIDCDGGDALDVDLVSEHDIGTCSGPGDCAAQCDAHCGGVAGEALGSQCEGHCAGGASDGAACSGPLDCPGGTCLGWTPDGDFVYHPDVCSCHCRQVGGAAPNGGFTCQIGVELVVEQFSPCGDGDAILHLGTQCMQLTSEQTQVTLLETVAGTVGPIAVQGAAKQCLDLAVAGPGGMALTGALNTFHGNLAADVADVFRLVCE